MILNITRSKDWQKCRQYEYNLHELRLAPLSKAEPLRTGTSLHHGLSTLLSKKDLYLAKREAQKLYEEELSGEMILPEEQALYSNRQEWVASALTDYSAKLPSEGFQVLMPEVNFAVALPNTYHHCHFVHKLLYNEGLLSEDNAQHPAQCYDPRCVIPHCFKGRTDAIVTWEGMVWLLEHKSSSISTSNYWRQWILDIQLTGYIYGIYHSINLRPQGVLLNRFSKPIKSAKDQTKCSIEREPFLRSDEDLARFEKQFTLIANDYEAGFRDTNIYMNTASCFNWNRECYFHKSCTDHYYEPDQFKELPMDYVEEEYYKILGLPLPLDTLFDKETLDE